MERDRKLLWWLNGWSGGATVQQIAVWWGCDFSTAARRVRKLVGAGLLRRLDANGLAIQPIVLTRLGCGITDDTLPPLSGIRVATWAHDSLIVDLEARILRRFGGGVLHPDRRIRANRQLMGCTPRHVPDAEVYRPGKRPIAIELELSMKAPRRLQAIIDSYASGSTYEAVYYLTTDARVARHVRRFTAGSEGFIHVTALMPSGPATQEIKS